MDDIVDEANLVAASGGQITEAQRLALRQNLPVVQRRSPSQGKPGLHHKKSGNVVVY